MNNAQEVQFVLLGWADIVLCTFFCFLSFCLNPPLDNKHIYPALCTHPWDRQMVAKWIDEAQHKFIKFLYRSFGGHKNFLVDWQTGCAVYMPGVALRLDFSKKGLHRQHVFFVWFFLESKGCIVTLHWMTFQTVGVGFPLYVVFSLSACWSHSAHHCSCLTHTSCLYSHCCLHKQDWSLLVTVVIERNAYSNTKPSQSVTVA